MISPYLTSKLKELAQMVDDYVDQKPLPPYISSTNDIGFFYEPISKARDFVERESAKDGRYTLYELSNIYDDETQHYADVILPNLPLVIHYCTACAGDACWCVASMNQSLRERPTVAPWLIRSYANILKDTFSSELLSGEHDRGKRVRYDCGPRFSDCVKPTAPLMRMDAPISDAGGTLFFKVVTCAASSPSDASECLRLSNSRNVPALRYTDHVMRDAPDLPLLRSSSSRPEEVMRVECAAVCENVIAINNYCTRTGEKPVYNVISNGPVFGVPQFVATLTLKSKDYLGQGSSKGSAKEDAAFKAVKDIEQELEALDMTSKRVNEERLQLRVLDHIRLSDQETILTEQMTHDMWPDYPPKMINACFYRMQSLGLVDREDKCWVFCSKVKSCDVDTLPHEVRCSATGAEYATLRAIAQRDGWHLETKLDVNSRSGEFGVSFVTGAQQEKRFVSEDLAVAANLAIKAALSSVLARGVATFADPPAVDWEAPQLKLLNKPDFLGKFNLFPTIAAIGDYTYPRLFALVEGDHSKLFRGEDLPITAIGDSKIFGLVSDTYNGNIKLKADYSMLPVELSNGKLNFRPWVEVVTGSSWELAARVLDRAKFSIPYAFTGAVAIDGSLASGEVSKKAELVRQVGYSVRHTVTGHDTIPLFGPGAPYPVRNVDFDIPLFDLTLDVSAKLPTYVAAIRTPATRKTTTVVRPSRTRLAPATKAKEKVVTTTVTTAPVKEYNKKKKLVRNTTSTHMRILDPAYLDVYTKALIDPFGYGNKVKVPDTIIYPSTTSAILQTLDLTADNNGNIAVMVMPWHNATVTTTNITNTSSTYDWKNAIVLDSAASNQTKSMFSQARPVCAGVRLVYTGSVLTAKGLLTGALSDPNNPLPVSYDNVNTLPEYCQFSVSAESAGIEVIWKPMTLYNQVYHDVDAWMVPEGVATVFLPYGIATNLNTSKQASWMKSIAADSGGAAYPVRIERNENPYMLVAGKGFDAGAPFRLEFTIHEEVTIKSSVIAVGGMSVSASSSNIAAIQQAANVMAQIPAARKPGSNFLGKAANIIRGMGNVAAEGFQMANKVRDGMRGLFIGK